MKKKRKYKYSWIFWQKIRRIPREIYRRRDQPWRFHISYKKWAHVLEEMVAFSQGISPDKDLEGFWALFLDEARKTQLGVEVAQEVKNLLVNRSWEIEEEDIRQELLYYLWFGVKWGSRNIHPAVVVRILSTNLRDHLFPILTRKEGRALPQAFSWGDVDDRLDRERLISKLPFNLRYLYYLHFYLGMEREEVFSLFMYTPRAYNLMMLKLMEELKGIGKCHMNQLISLNS